MSFESQVVEYRGGNNKVYPTIKLPGIQKISNVTLKKGLYIGDKSLWKKNNQLNMNTHMIAMMTIILLDETQSVAMSWKLTNAFPVKMNVTDMRSDGDEIAIESMEFAHEGLSIVS